MLPSCVKLFSGTEYVFLKAKNIHNINTLLKRRWCYCVCCSCAAAAVSFGGFVHSLARIVIVDEEEETCKNRVAGLQTLQCSLTFRHLDCLGDCCVSSQSLP